MAEKTQKESGLRFNRGKLRYDLLHPAAQEGIVKVLTSGAVKYSARNWEKGISWTDCIASLKRHLAAFEIGEDIDPETGLRHIDHLQCNAHFLSAYYSIAPEFDDRPHLLRPLKKIGLDIDDVICAWITEWAKFQNIPVPTAWNFDWDLQEKFEKMRMDGTLNDFYLNLPMRENPDEIPFVPDCYITNRPVIKAVTEMWLKINGFPLKPVFQVNNREEKLAIAKERKLDIFVDDNYQTFCDMNQNGICCFLYDALHNQRHNVGYRRIKFLKEIQA